MDLLITSQVARAKLQTTSAEINETSMPRMVPGHLVAKYPFLELPDFAVANRRWTSAWNRAGVYSVYSKRLPTVFSRRARSSSFPPRSLWQALRRKTVNDNI